MKRLVFIMFLLSTLNACSVVRQTNDAAGVYIAKILSPNGTPIVETTITLKQDNTFNLEWHSYDHEYKNCYNGQWKPLDKNRIWLEFDEFPLPADYLGWHAVSYQDREVELISKNEIKTDNVVFKRIRRRP
jgi:hypothetical protein